eukprot:NODE_432_length_7521_cov_0.745891.p3 type:complete len:325 gc:universal NODE_432_length_7521_cov_0.745891:1838-864(-)
MESAVKKGPIFVEKYRPKCKRDLAGNTDVFKRLCNFLIEFSSEMIKNRAVMLAGPPGIGKTSMAHVAAKECGFDILEFNASDTRSKTSMQRVLAESFQSGTISSYFGTASKKKVIIMDEVDGLGAGDRGGNQQLILFIKKTKVPVICICNDKQNPKVKSLLNYCDDLQFRKPTAQQIKARITKICSKEGINLAANVVEVLAENTNGDVRQILNILNTYALNPTEQLEYLDAKKHVTLNEKDITMGIFDIAGKGFSRDYSRQSLTNQLDLFFNDYDLGPLMVQENYLSCRIDDNLQDLIKMADAADSISMGDLIQTSIRTYLFLT